MNYTVTVDDIMLEEPCEDKYPRERIQALAGDRATMTPQEIAALDIPIEDRIWILSQLLFRLSPHRVNRVARMIALDVCEYWDPPDITWWYLTSGGTALWEASWEAAWEATWDAAKDAASDASCDAARDASTCDTSRDTVWNTSRAAARAVSWAEAKAEEWAKGWAEEWEALWDAAMQRYLGWIVRFGWEMP